MILAQEKKVRTISRNPHPVLIQLPKEKDAARLGDMEILIRENVRRKKNQNMLVRAYNFFKDNRP